MTEEEDATITEEILVAEDVKADLEVKEVDLLQEEKVEETEVSEAIEVRLQEEKAEETEVLEEKEATLHQEEKALQDVLKAQVILLDQEDREEANDFR
jgi:hypothetical protein